MGVPGLPAGSDQGGAARPGLGRGLLLSCPRDAPRGAGGPCGRSRPSLPCSEDSLIDAHAQHPRLLSKEQSRTRPSLSERIPV